MAHFQYLLAACALATAQAADQPFWGCGMLGALTGIHSDGSTSAAMKKVIDALKTTNKHDGKVAYWNWNFAPMAFENCQGTSGGHQYLTEDFVFMPENWGVTTPKDE